MGRLGERGAGTTDGLDKKRREIAGEKVREMDQWRALKPGLSLAEIQDREQGIGPVMLTSDAEHDISKQEIREVISKCAATSNRILHICAMETYSMISFFFFGSHLKQMEIN